MSDAGERSELLAHSSESELLAPSQYEREKAEGRRTATGALKLKELSGKHLRMINLHMSGLKGKAIAKELDATEAWVSTVLNDPLVQAEIRQRFVDVDNEMFVKATDVIDRSMDSEDPAIALRSAEMIWRSRGRFEKKEQVRTTAEDVVQRMLELAASQGDASVTISTHVGDNPRPAGEASRRSGALTPEAKPPWDQVTIEAEPLKPWHAGYRE